MRDIYSLILMQLFAAANTKYSITRLEDICKRDGSKVEVPFHFDKPKVFTYNSVVEGSVFQCHLEFELATGDGFIVFIDQMDIEFNPTCSKDYIQFGWDVGFITVGKSEKMCQKFESHEHPEDEKEEKRLDYIRESSFSSRIYNKMQNEIDFWIQLHQKSNIRKHLKLTITPARSCHRWQDHSQMQCPLSAECIHRDLFCDGMINCPSDALDEDFDSCEDYVENGFFESPIGIPIIIILAVVLPIGAVILVLSVYSICRKYLELCRSHNRENNSESSGAFPSLLGGALRRRRSESREPESSRTDEVAALALSQIISRGSRVADCQGDRQLRMAGGARQVQRNLSSGGESPPPSAPPPYAEIYKDDPPNYFDIVRDEENENEEQTP